MKKIFYMIIFSSLLFANSSQHLEITSGDIGGCAYSQNGDLLAVFDNQNLLKIINLNTQDEVGIIKGKRLTSASFDKDSLYVGTNDGEILKFNQNGTHDKSVFDASSFGLDTSIFYLKFKNNKLYAFVGKNTFISYDVATDKLHTIKLDKIYRVSSCIILDDRAIVTGWDRSVYEINLTNLQAKELFRTKSVVLSSQELLGDVVFGLANGEILTLKDGNYIKISDFGVKSLALIDDEIYMGLKNGEIYKSDLKFKDIKIYGANPDTVVKIFGHNKSIVVVMLNGKVKFNNKS
ncbi:WD40 repeat domain-containing protein [Campylobacter californiensis]|uniref:hypothetical protein n=1 Tax=Campylobacter californiensis TaxID=1032243 RepID=UPI0014729174|nr:hypothetical protein [Campylobacter sp. RM12916]MBE3609000.1 hypothetical protein [Campylobacter sp. RM12916]